MMMMMMKKRRWRCMARYHRMERDYSSINSDTCVRFFFIFVDTHSLYFYKNSQFHFLFRVAFATINAIHKFKETQQQQKRKENEEIKYTSGFSMIALPRIAQNRKRARKLGLTNNQCQLACAIKIDIIWVTFTLYILRNSIHKKTLCVSLEECAIWRQWQSTFF